MPTVRLSGKVLGVNDPQRTERAELLFHLFANGWDIYNGNGDQIVHLSNIQKKIIESDAFIYTQKPSLEDYFNLTSVFVGFQTLDGDLKDKPAIIVNNDGSWDYYCAIFEQLHKLGTVKEVYTNYISVAQDYDEVIKILGKKYDKIDLNHARHEASSQPDVMENTEVVSAGSVADGKSSKPMPSYNVCVFCSASIRKDEYLQEGYDVGKFLAENNYGCVSGAGKTGIMGSVVAGAIENGGWAGGSNVPHIIELEGLPEGLTEFWPRGDIYTRMEIMIEKSDTFVIMPGGMGTIQELFAILILKQQDDDLMKGKKIAIYNKHDKDLDIKFWTPLIKIIDYLDKKFADEFVVVDTLEELFEAIKQQ